MEEEVGAIVFWEYAASEVSDPSDRVVISLGWEAFPLMPRSGKVQRRRRESPRGRPHPAVSLAAWRGEQRAAESLGDFCSARGWLVAGHVQEILPVVFQLDGSRDANQPRGAGDNT
ncbi:hypothetical protein PVAR5_2892 [Paecilomyces variotii No. 5]|uniref:Uncharacterized protein n=1 Tax=Byssochlamys spectabilis (strain No. 5 / NBRC 109023) TaxID=1356009 RepID=V5FQI9_BYSSN|nr:hypothetical protein PVAR5_2892 [Paecilomyces variotii No. 5]